MYQPKSFGMDSRFLDLVRRWGTSSYPPSIEGQIRTLGTPQSTRASKRPGRYYPLIPYLWFRLSSPLAPGPPAPPCPLVRRRGAARRALPQACYARGLRESALRLRLP